MNEIAAHANSPEIAAVESGLENDGVNFIPISTIPTDSDIGIRIAKHVIIIAVRISLILLSDKSSKKVGVAATIITNKKISRGSKVPEILDPFLDNACTAVMSQQIAVLVSIALPIDRGRIIM